MTKEEMDALFKKTKAATAHMTEDEVIRMTAATIAGRRAKRAWDADSANIGKSWAQHVLGLRAKFWDRVRAGDAEAMAIYEVWKTTHPDHQLWQH
jgi:hypothetical protein